MSLQHVICLVRLVKLTLEKLKKKRWLSRSRKMKILVYVICMRIMHSVLSSFSFQSKVYSQTMLT